MEPRGVATFGIIAIMAGAALAAVACGDDYTEAGATPTAADAGPIDSGADAPAVDANAIVKCGVPNCTTACCLVKDAGTTPTCCGEDRNGWDIVLECADDKNCPSGQVCCLHTGTTQTIAECATDDQCMDVNGQQMCSGNAIDPRCPSPLKCTTPPPTSNLPAGYALCLATGSGG